MLGLRENESLLHALTMAIVRSPICSRKVALVAILSLFVIVYKFLWLSGFDSERSIDKDVMSFHTVNTVTPEINIPEFVIHNWAQYAPYFPAAEYTQPPKACAIDQVNILRRHGARYPTSNAGARIEASVTKLKTAISYENPRLKFLKNYTYNLGTDDLVAYGRAQSFDAGQFDYLRYKHLVHSASLPFVRASSSPRVVDSAMNWTDGFTFSSYGRVTPILNVVLQESLNDTLDDKMCPNAGSGDAETNTWQAIYAASTAERLNKAAPGANLAVHDISNLISLCAFDTLAHLTESPFCRLFEHSDYEGYEYFGDLNKYYGTGYGQALGPVQGVGYVNELLARLTESPVRDNTQTNRTLDADPRTFPLDRAMYVDFSHDNQMIAIYSALGLLRPTRQRPARLEVNDGRDRDRDRNLDLSLDLDPTRPDPNRLWVVSRLVPFSGTFVVERMQCRGRHIRAHSITKSDTFVRILIDDAVQDLRFCGAGPDGICALDDFIASQFYARNDGNGDFEKCFSE